MINKKNSDMKTNGFLQDKDGNYSSTRLQCFLAFITAVFLTTSVVFMDGVTLGDGWPLILTFLGYSLGAKVFQNITDMLEKKSEK